MIFDSSIEHAQAAGARFAKRSGVRGDQENRTQAEVETPERLQKRLDRLTSHAMNTSAQLFSTTEEAAEMLEGAVDEIGLEKVLGQPDFQNIAFLELALAVSRFVGRIVIRSSKTTLSGYGTGFMVSPRLLLTNNHVLPDANSARFSEVEFDYQYDRFRRLLPSAYFALDPDAFFLTDKALDFSLVAVADKSTDERALNPYGWTKLIAAEGKALLGDPLNIIQHPKGQPKQIVFRENRLVDLFEQFAHYVADTEPGSSGSPVYNDQWELVALHHSGVPRRAPNGDLLRKDGNVWRRGGDPEDLDWVANEGIRVSALVKHIQAQTLMGLQKELRDEMLEREAPDPRLAMEGWDAGPKPKGAPSAPPVPPSPSAGGGKVTLTVPLRITVELGGAEGMQTASAATVVVNTDGAGMPAAALAPSPELAEALAELQQARERTYYDRQADEKARDDYWGDLRTGSQSPKTLFEAVRDHLRNTHTRPLPYRPALHVYPWVDLRPGLRPTVKSLYSGKGFDPQEMIEADFAVEAKRVEIAAAMESMPGRMPFEAALEAAEANLPYNCEHVVPQSWFAKKEPMKGDLHHLFTCEARCNSFRGNTPFYDFPDFEEAVRDDCGKREHNRFEPNAGKGAAARATLYFLLRYPGEIDRAPGEYDEDRIGVLLAWHRRYAPDEYELHRNAAIHEKQGNRNPLIDFPDWADRIDFSIGLGGAPDK